MFDPRAFVLIRFSFNSSSWANGFSIAILSAMSCERFASIVYPVLHRNRMTRKKLSNMSPCSSLFSFITTALTPVKLAYLYNFVSLLSELKIYWVWCISILRFLSPPDSSKERQCKESKEKRSWSKSRKQAIESTREPREPTGFQSSQSQSLQEKTTKTPRTSRGRSSTSKQPTRMRWKQITWRWRL